MSRRYVAIWFRQLLTDRVMRQRPALKDQPFVLAAPERGRMVVKAASMPAQGKGVYPGMVVADCRALVPGLEVIDYDAAMPEQLLNALAEWCLRYTPVVAVDLPDGLLLDVTGCAHLWGGEAPYLKDMAGKLQGYGYQARVALADTIGAAWAVSRFGPQGIIPNKKQLQAIMDLPPAALRLELPVTERLAKLGLYRIKDFIAMPRAALRRRFGQAILTRLDQALGKEAETLKPVKPLVPYQERLPCPEPILTAAGIEIALKRLLEVLCRRLEQEGKGLRSCIFKGYRVDGNVQQIAIATTRPSRHMDHLFRLFAIRIPSLEPALGIELFLLEAPVVEDLSAAQEALWHSGNSHNETMVMELLDRLAGRVGMQAICHYLPAAHYWPERSVKRVTALQEQPSMEWRTDLPRPVHLLPAPEPIQVAVPLPDYPPMHFHHQGVLHRVVRADGPERIEPEWWLEQGVFRDYYCVEDEHGARYWLFRLGHYDNCEPEWFVHGFFA